MDDKFNGIVLYSIELDGCLNGVWTNEPNGGEIRNEIAKKETPTPGDHTGDYVCFYFEVGNIPTQERLNINLSNGQFTFRWSDLNGTPKFEGRGYRMNEKQIAVKYWVVK